jgi:molybdopterin-guanine dinucleotide biosynthesis protein A
VILKEHKKHPDITRPSLGNFGRNEWAIVGGKCEQIKLLADSIINALSPEYKCAYADTSHSQTGHLSGRISNGALLEYTDQITHQQVDHSGGFNSHKLREVFAAADLVLVNGNHHQARAQIVIIDPGKKDSLQKRLEELTNVKMILLADSTSEIFNFLKNAVPNWAELPVYRLNETDTIIRFFEKQIQASRPVLKGLVLAGGVSRRMGFDKGTIDWHGKEQRYYMADLLGNFCEDVFISCRPGQEQEIDKDYPVITDTFTDLGPFGAILSAFREKPDNAWLVVACDLPLINTNTLRYLTDNRKASSIATAFQSTYQNFPEPLITIWEPKSYPVLLSFLAQGYSCPRKVLINSDVTLLAAPDPIDLTNVNTPEEMDKVKEALHQQIAAG